jgi:tetratricopeptide (TPR) repeat protein
MNLGEYYLKKMKKEDASLNLGEYHQEKDNFDLALDAFYDAYRFARQIDFETRPALCSWGDLLMDSDLFDEAVQLYTDAEDAKDSRLSDASKLPQELRKSKLCAMIKLARALRKSGRLALSINKLVNVISEISIKLARASRKRGRKQALLIRELTSDISEASSKECVFRLVSMLREIGGSCIAKGFLIKI